MKVHIVSLYTLVYLLLGSKYKINFCNASESEDDIDIEDPSEAESVDIDLIDIDLDAKKSTDKFKYTSHVNNGSLYTTRGHYRVKNVKSGGTSVWSASKENYPNRVYFEPRRDKPLLKVIYSNDEYDPPKLAAAPAKAAKPAPSKAVPVKSAKPPVKKTATGQSFVQMSLPRTEDEDEVSVKVPRGATLKHKVPPTRIAQPVAASQPKYASRGYAEFRMPPTDDEGDLKTGSFVECPLPATEDEGDATSRPTKLRSTAVHPSHGVPAVQKGPGFVQMALPKTDDEGSSIQPTRAAAHICTPCIERGDGFVQMPLPRTEDEGDAPPSHGPPRKHIVKVETVHASGKAHRDGGRPTSHPSPLRSGVEAGQSFLEFGIPPTEDEGTGPQAGQNYLEFKLVSSGAEDDRGAIPTHLPKRKAIVSSKFLDQPMPSSTEAESEDFDMENDEEIQFLLRFIEDMKKKLDELRELLRQMDEQDALRAKTGAV